MASKTRKLPPGLYLQPGSDIIMMRLSVRGQKVRESTHTANIRDAAAYRDRRKAELLVGMSQLDNRKTMIGSIVDDYLAAMKRDGLKTAAKAEERWRVHLSRVFDTQPVNLLTTDHINNYITNRQKEEAANATINRELAILKRAYTLALQSDPPKVNRLPKIPRLKEDNVRRGFVQDEDHDKLLEQAEAIGPWMKGLYLLGYTFGFREEEATTLRVDQVDVKNKCIWLERTKTGEARVAYMTTELFAAILPLVKRMKGSDLVFTREDGSPAGDIRKAWWRMCVNAGLGEVRCRVCQQLLDSTAYCSECKTSNVGYKGLLFHDLRRTAIRNMRRYGISEKIAMLISGHKTRSVFDRYNIVDEADLREAASMIESGDTLKQDIKKSMMESSDTQKQVSTGHEKGMNITSKLAVN
jgi:integrase